MTKNWEETVMDSEQITLAILNANEHANRAEAIDITAKKQAEITWKARDPEIAEAKKEGYEEGYQKAITFNESAERNMYKQGMREVVEWIEANAYHVPEIPYENWKAFLKEKGLNEE